MVAARNLFRKWGAHPIWGEVDLKTKLLRFVAKNQPNVAILRVPTNILDPKKLLIRSQKTLYQLPKRQEGFLDIIRSNNSHKHLTDGLPAKDFAKYDSMGHPLEFIYKDNIPIADGVEQIGTINIPNASIHADKRWPGYNLLDSLSTVFRKTQ